jgi:beta-lactamase class A
MRQGYGVGVIVPVALPPPPVIQQPAERSASFGLVTGTVGPGTVRIRVHEGARLLADLPLRGQRFSVRVELPPRDTTVRVTSVAGDGGRRTASVAAVFGLPRVAEPRIAIAREDAALARTVHALGSGFRGTSGVYVQSLVTGAGAAWNAKARFPAASTLKLAIAVAVLRAHEGLPPRGSSVESLLRAMLLRSDNEAANALEVWLAGSTSAGSHVIEGLLRTIGLRDTLMYGGYEIEDVRRLQGPIPIRLERQPPFGIGKYTTAWDLARLHRAVWLAAGNLGPLARSFPGGFTPADARYLLRLLALVPDPGKLDRFLLPGELILHKGGWLATGRHDAGLVVWPGGVLVAAVLTWSPSGVGVAGDVLAGRVARAARDRFAG